jgi:hypothetical protein
LLHEVFWFGCTKPLIKRNDQEMPHAQIPNQSDLVCSRGEQVRRGLRPQYFFRVRIECDHDRRSSGQPGMFGGCRDHCLMSEMHAVENADGEKERTWQLSEFGNGMERFH